MTSSSSSSPEFFQKALHVIHAQPAVVPPLAAAVVSVAGGEPFSFSEVSIETPGEGEGPPSVECTSLRRRGDSNPSGGCVSCRGRSLLGWLAVVGVVALLCLLVGCCVLVARSFAALVSRVELLEAGSGAAAAWEGGRSCSKCAIGFFV